MTYVGLKELVRQGGVTFSFTNRLEVQKESRELLLEAIEKQIPKKPAAGLTVAVVDGRGNEIKKVSELTCPICNQQIIYMRYMRGSEQRYCFKCGQAIDWSDDDENK